MDELDQNFSSLVQSEVLFSLTDPGQMKALKALVNKSVPQEAFEKGNLVSTRKGESPLQVCLDYSRQIKVQIVNHNPKFANREL